MVGRPAWKEAVTLKLSFQNPFSCFLALCSGDAHGVSQRRLYFGLFSGQPIKIADALVRLIFWKFVGNSFGNSFPWMPLVLPPCPCASVEHVLSR